MPITRDQQTEIRAMTEEMVKRICLDDKFLKKIAEKVTSGVLEIIDNKLSQFEKKLDEVKNSICLLDRKYGEEISGLTDQIVEMQKKLVDNEREFPNMAHIVSEVNDMRRRENNVLIFGISEDCTNETVYSLNVCREIIPDLDAAGIEVTRLGRRQPNKTRPMKVRFMEGSHVSVMMKNKKKLGLSDEFKHLNVRPDLTIRQREYQRQVWKDLNARRECGEEDIYISYSDGIPIIRQKNVKKHPIRKI